MALEFPDSPADGDVYENYVYSTAKGAWQAKPLKPAVTATQSNAPSAPADGDMWFNTNDGTTYVWYDDGDSAQWVEMVAPITANGYYSPNYIINGGFDIWQRGTSFTGITSAVYTADRWAFGRLNSAPEGIVSRSTDVPQNFAYSIKVQRRPGTTAVNSMRLSQSLENSGKEFAGKTVTLSVYMKAGANYSGGNVTLKIVSSSIAPESVSYVSGKYFNPTNPDFSDINTNVSLSSSWQRYVFSANIPSTSNAMQVLFQWDPTGTAGVDDSVYVTGVQLEEGIIATPFRRNANSIQGELAACQRYYQRINQRGGFEALFASGIQSQTTQASVDLVLPAPLRAQPTTVVFSDVRVGDATSFQASATLSTFSRSTENAVSLLVTFPANGAVFRPIFLQGRNTAPFNSFIEINAEL